MPIFKRRNEANRYPADGCQPRQEAENFYPPNERAGFNFGKDILRMIDGIGLDEKGQEEFIRGILKPLKRQLETIQGINNY